jgi:hypothetical protein
VGADAADHQGERQENNRQIRSETGAGQDAELEEGGSVAHLHQPDAGLPVTFGKSASGVVMLEASKNVVLE